MPREEEKRVKKEILETFKITPREKQLIQQAVKQKQREAALRGEDIPSKSQIYRAAIAKELGLQDLVKAKKQPGRFSETLRKEEG